MTTEELEIDGECEVSDEIPEYSHSAGCNHPC